MSSRTEASHWIVVPVGFVLAALGVFVLEPMLVDVIVQSLLTIPEEGRALPTLAVDLVLSTATLLAALYVVAWWARKPKVRAVTVVALLVLCGIALLMSSPSSDLPEWYRWCSYASVAVAWLLAGHFYTRPRRGED